MLGFDVQDVDAEREKADLVGEGLSQFGFSCVEFEINRL